MDAIDRMDFGLYMEIAAQRARRRGRCIKEPAAQNGQFVQLRRGTIDQLAGW